MPRTSIRALLGACLVATSAAFTIPAPAKAITINTLGQPTPRSDGACSTDRGTSFFFFADISGNTADFVSRDPLDEMAIYMLDSNGVILEALNLFVSLVDRFNQTSTLIVQTAPTGDGLFSLVVDNITSPSQVQSIGATFTPVSQVGSVTFDASLLDEDCPGPDATLRQQLLERDQVVQAVETFSLNNARTFIGNLPSLENLGEEENFFTANFTENGGVASFGASSFGLGVEGRFGLWARAGATAFDDDGGTLDYDGVTGFGQLGLDYAASSQLRVGWMLQGDATHQYAGTGGVDIDGYGFLTGPYAVYRLSPALSFEAVALGGAGFNTAENNAGAEEDYTSTRGLVSAALTGTFTSEITNWFLRPTVRGSYYIEDSESFTLVGVAIGSQTVSLGELRFGPDVGYRIETSAGEFRPFVGVDGVATFATGVAANSSDPEGFSGSVNAGVETSLRSGWRLSATARYDGLGDDDYEAVSGALEFSIPLN